MSHLNQQLFCQRFKAMFPQYFKNRRVLDIGGADINGTVRYLFKDCNYFSIDIWPGPGVDRVAKVQDLYYGFKYDTICCLEVAEHDKEYSITIQEALKRLVPGGLFLFTCASTGRLEHGTKRTSPQDSPVTTDYYRNLTRTDLEAVPGFGDMSGWKFWYCEQRDTDLRFFGIKNGGEKIRFKPSLLLYIRIYFDYWFAKRRRDIKNAMERKPTATEIYKALRDSLEKKQSK